MQMYSYELEDDMYFMKFWILKNFLCVFPYVLVPNNLELTSFFVFVSNSMHIGLHDRDSLCPVFSYTNCLQLCTLYNTYITINILMFEKPWCKNTETVNVTSGTLGI